jgi:hypothetical protein
MILKAERPTDWAGRRVGWRRWRYLGAAGETGPNVAMDESFNVACQAWRFPLFHTTD